MPERSNGAVSKTVVPYGHPGFESLSLRRLGVTLRSLQGYPFPCSSLVFWGECFAVTARCSCAWRVVRSIFSVLPAGYSDTSAKVL